jgi:uncharacterized protein YceK
MVRAVKSNIVLLLLISLTTVGCGTICNHILPADHSRPYGGVNYDIETAVYEKGSAYLFFLDVPLSAAGDTLLLPCDLWITSKRDRQ